MKEMIYQNHIQNSLQKVDFIQKGNTYVRV